MARFEVFQIRDNSKTIIIGYQVMSQSKFGGQRVHFSRCGTNDGSLDRAKAECEVYAARLQVEADANYARNRAA